MTTNTNQPTLADALSASSDTDRIQLDAHLIGHLPRYRGARRSLVQMRERLARRLSDHSCRMMRGAEIAEVAALIVKAERTLASYVQKHEPWAAGSAVDLSVADYHASADLAFQCVELLRASREHETTPNTMLDAYGKRGWRAAERRARGL